MKLRLLILTVPLVLAACSMTPITDENSPFSRVPTGSTLVLKQGISMPVNSFGVILTEGGDPSPEIRRDERDTRCVLETHRRLTSGLSIKAAAEFRVASTERRQDFVSRKPVQVAFGGFQDATSETNITVINLQSEIYPDIRNIRCTVTVDFGMGRPISVTLIRWAIGGNFHLLVPEPQPGKSEQTN